MIQLKSLLFEQSSSLSEKDFWILVTICVAETLGYKPLEYAKVAQSIYNRLNCNCGYGDTVSSIILDKGQYQPVFKNKSDWENIQDYKTAVTALWNAKRKEKGWTKDEVKSRIKNAAGDITNSALQSKAAIEIGSRTEFLAYTPKDTNAVGATPDTGNVWFWNYNGKKNFYDNKKLSATTIPAFPSIKIDELDVPTEINGPFPNPVKPGDEVTVRIINNLPAPEAEIILYDITGKQIKKHTWNNVTKGILQFNAPADLTGTYMLVIYINDERIIKKISIYNR